MPAESAAPRQRGSKHAWTLIEPYRGISRMACGKIRPNAAVTIASGRKRSISSRTLGSFSVAA
jgi:hypothetical protein